jgi:hypothetical protein
MKISRSDQEAIAALMYESYDDSFAGLSDDAVVIEMEPMSQISSNEVDNSAITVELKKLAEYSKRLSEMCESTEFSPWMIMKLVKATDYVSDVYYNVTTEADFANSGFEQAL